LLQLFTTAFRAGAELVFTVPYQRVGLDHLFVEQSEYIISRR